MSTVTSKLTEPLYSNSTTPISKLFDKTKTTTFDLIFSSSSNWPLVSTYTPTASTSKLPHSIQVQILDSSFNPPHKAHLALTSPVISNRNKINNNDHQNKNKNNNEIKATLLVLSIKNADKESKVGVDASIEDRLEMMRAMALEMKENNSNDGTENVAVVVISQPSFVEKSKVIRNELQSLLTSLDSVEESPVIKLCFSQGWDTLIRFFDPKYYQSPSPPIKIALNSFFSIDQSTIVCARRGDVSLEEEEAFLNSEHVKEWRDKVEMFDLDLKVRNISSTEVRKLVGQKKSDERDKKLSEVMLRSVREIVESKELYKL